jgi:Holliday junction resolvasome RuvABC endonuclease subunit
MKPPDFALAIDIGLTTGWALGGRHEPYASGTWKLDTLRREGAGMRYLTLERSIRRALEGHRKPTLIVYEEVRAHMGVDAAHVYGGCQAVIQSLATELEIPWTSVPVATIKIQATGKGNARKAAMVLAAERRWPRIKIVDDNHADALWLLDYAMKEILK